MNRSVRLIVFMTSGASISVAWGQPRLPTLFVGNNVSDTISVFRVNPDGTLVEIAGSPFPAGEDVQALALTADGRYLAATNAGQSQQFELLWLFAVDEEGALTPVPGAPFQTGDGPLGLAFSISNVLISPAAGPDQLWTFKLVEDDLVDAPGSPRDVETFPNEADTTPDGRFAYVSHLFGGISAYEIHASDGSVTELPGSPFGTPGSAFELVVSPDGKNLYLGLGLDDAVAGYEIQSDGTLQPLPDTPYPTGQTSAVNLAMDPSGRFVFVAHVVSDSIMTMRREADGRLTAVPESVRPIGADVRKVVASDAHVFVTDESTIDPGRGVMVYTLEKDGQLTLVPGSPFEAGSRPQDMELFLPDEVIDCGQVRRLKTKCSERLKLTAKLKTRLPEGTELTFLLDDVNARRVTLNANGQAKTKWFTDPGPHEVSLLECPDVRDAVSCP